MSQKQFQAKTAVICVIGDEILSGRTRDSNSHYLARRLAEIGVEVERIVVLPDRRDCIVDFLREWAERCDYLFTSGGIGPTHDDITREMVAEATGRRLVMHGEAEGILRDHYGSEMTEARLSMALLPEGAELIYNPITAAPGCIVENIFVLPGIPEILEVMFESIVDRLPASILSSGSGKTRCRASNSPVSPSKTASKASVRTWTLDPF